MINLNDTELASIAAGGNIFTEAFNWVTSTAVNGVSYLVGIGVASSANQSYIASQGYPVY